MYRVLGSLVDKLISAFKNCLASQRLTSWEPAYGDPINDHQHWGSTAHQHKHQPDQPKCDNQQED